MRTSYSRASLVGTAVSVGLVFAISAAVFVASSAVTPGVAQAGPFDGKIVTSSKRIPTTAKSKRAYFAKLRKQRASKFQEDKKKKQWKIYFAAFFKKPLNDFEVTIKLYDVTDRKQPHLKAAFEQFLDGRGQTELISDIKLTRDKFGVNRRIRMTIENRGRVLAESTFEIRGEAEKYSGKVDFTEDDAE